MYFIYLLLRILIYVYNMNVSISTNYARGISVPRGANVKASKVARVQSPLLDLEAFSETATREKAIMSRLILAALSGTIFALAAIFTTVIDWTILGWRNFWLAVCITAFIAIRLPRSPVPSFEQLPPPQSGLAP